MKPKTTQSSRFVIILFAMLLTTLTAAAQETIKVRGTSTDSFTNTIKPLVIIDGVESASINSISPDMVESVSVLKDASATAIYGEKAKNGVILITTKAGATKPGTNAQHTVNIIKVRGTSTDSLTNTIKPLVIIDEVESASINSISPDMVESVSVLKDASATAIYGEKAKNGVILITTKTGAKKSDKNADVIDLNEVTVVAFGTKNDSKNQGVLITAEVMPKFNGSSDFMEFQKWTQSKLIYPQEAKINGTQGRVIARFIVNTEGKVTNVEIARSVSKELDDAVIKLIESSPDWTPGENRGQKVSVSFVIPIDFKL